ncbi:hypothetical protein TW83_00295 [Paracoccus sp. S4493]|uniref:hypothetical protein n=1 Tax=Paracoccus sp. S4493 TaxID=579490 RepID=UPI0005F9D307|nr:hypothetical protein [Paracoccus sp. S4493]KJZ33014.1 hypothetical protein TW83_00295 [Paracoccus sp. S4493]
MPAAFVWVGGIIAAGGVGAAIVTSVISLGVNLAVSAVVKKFGPKQQGPRPRDLQSNIRSGTSDRVQHFGRVRVGGTLMFSDYKVFTQEVIGVSIPGTRRAYVLLAVSTGGISGIDQWYLDGKKVNVNAEGYVTTAPWNGNKVRLRVRTGMGSEFAGGHWPDLHDAFPTRWIAGQHRLDGVATVLAEFDSVAPEEVSDVYPGARPPEITMTLRGAPCYEPATGNASFTDNVARHALHYLSDAGAGLIPLEEFDLPSWFAGIEASRFDLPTAGGTRMRFAGGGSYALNEPAKDVADRILQAGAASLYLTQEGKIGIRMGVYEAPTLVIDKAKIVSMDYGPGKSRLDRVTTLVPEYVEPSLDYTETTADPWQNARAIARFGEPKPQELPMPWVQHHGQARHLAKIAAARENPMITASLSLRFWGLRLIGEERVFLHRPDRGLNMVPMRITGLSLDLSASDGVIKVELESEDPAAFPFTRPEEGVKPSAPARSANGRQPIPAPVIEQVTVNSDGNTLFLSGVVEPIAGYAFGVQFRRSPNGPWSRAEFNQETGYWRTPDLADGRLYDVRARRFFPGLTSLLWERQADITRASPWTQITGIQVIADQTPPAPPELIQAGIEGNRLVFSFAPDLGANYRQTGIWRGPNNNFANATFVRWLYDQASTVQGSVMLTASPQTYFLRSSNGSGVHSTPVNIGTY